MRLNMTPKGATHTLGLVKVCSDLEKKDIFSLKIAHSSRNSDILNGMHDSKKDVTCLK